MTFDEAQPFHFGKKLSVVIWVFSPPKHFEGGRRSSISAICLVETTICEMGKEGGGWGGVSDAGDSMKMLIAHL